MDHLRAQVLALQQEARLLARNKDYRETSPVRENSYREDNIEGYCRMNQERLVSPVIEVGRGQTPPLEGIGKGQCPC